MINENVVYINNMAILDLLESNLKLNELLHNENIDNDSCRLSYNNQNFIYKFGTRVREFTSNIISLSDDKTIISNRKIIGKMCYNYGLLIMGKLLTDRSSINENMDGSQYDLKSAIDSVYSVYEDKVDPLFEKFLLDDVNTKPKITPVFNNLMGIGKVRSDFSDINIIEFINLTLKALYYSLIGVILIKTTKNDIDNVKSGKKLLSIIGDKINDKDGIMPSARFAHAIKYFIKILNYVESSTGINFSDKYTSIFKSIHDDVAVNVNFIDNDKSIINNISSLLDQDNESYIGDNYYDMITMYQSAYILNTPTSLRYIPPIIKKINEDNAITSKSFVNIDYDEIDIRLYEDLVKYAMILRVNLNTPKTNGVFVNNFYILIATDLIINNLYNKWTDGKVRRIVNINNIRINGKSVDLNSIPNPKAMDMVNNKLSTINAKYLEASLVNYSKYIGKLSNSDINDIMSTYMRMYKVDSEYVKSLHNDLTSAVVSFKNLKLPYLFSIGSYIKDASKYVPSENDIDKRKMSKIFNLDQTYTKGINNPSSILDIIQDNKLDFSVLSDEKASSEIVEAIRSLNTNEFLYLLSL